MISSDREFTKIRARIEIFSNASKYPPKLASRLFVIVLNPQPICKTMKRLLLSPILLIFFAASCAEAQVKQSAAKKPAFDAQSLLKKQILLTNTAIFADNRILEGGSGFLIRHNNQTFAVSAKHLLGEAGGVEPEVNLTQLDKSLTIWRMTPRVVVNAATETVNLNAKGLDFKQTVHDILLLNVASETFDLAILKPNFALPAVGESLYLIGCPYSETHCKQNVYRLKFAEYDKTEAALFCEITSDVDLRGFSGAPVVNQNGEAVGVLVSSVEANGKIYAAATHIKEIQKIK